MSNPDPLPEQQSPSWEVSPTTRVRRAIGRSSATVGYPSPMTDVTSGARPNAGHRDVCWDRLGPIEQSLLVVASRDDTLDRACGSWAHRPRRPIAIEMTKQAAAMLFENGLIGFYRVDDGYPDLSEVDVRMVFTDRTYWDCEHVNAHQAGMFLTTAGEDVVRGP